MIYVYKALGYFFSSEKAAEEAIRRTPKDWGSAVGGFSKKIERISVHDSASAWGSYSGRQLDE